MRAGWRLLGRLIVGVVEPFRRLWAGRGWIEEEEIGVIARGVRVRQGELGLSGTSFKIEGECACLIDDNLRSIDDCRISREIVEPPPLMCISIINAHLNSHASTTSSPFPMAAPSKIF